MPLIPTLSQNAFEIIGQCDRCLDFFTVLVTRSPLREQRFEVAETPRMTWRTNRETKEHFLVHRPGICSGKVRLFYGSATPSLSPSSTHEGRVLPGAVYPPTTWR